MVKKLTSDTVARTGFTLAIALLVSMLFFLTLPLGPQARLVPMYVVVPTLLLLGIQLFREWWSAISSAQSPPSMSPAAHREFLAIAWLLLLALLTTVLGLSIGIPLYLFVYLRFRARASRRSALIASLIGYGTLKVIFSVVLNVDLHTGLIYPW